MMKNTMMNRMIAAIGIPGDPSGAVSASGTEVESVTPLSAAIVSATREVSKVIAPP